MNPFENFIRFVECELASLANRKEKKRGETDLETANALLASERQKIDLFKERIATLQKNMHSYELESRMYVQREKEVRQRLDITRNAKEYAACQHELEEIAHMRDVNEDRLMETLRAYEAAQADYEDKRESLEAEVQKQRAAVFEKQKHNLELESAGRELAHRCIELKKTVCAELLEKYDHMKKTVADPFVPVREHYCSACNFQIAQKDLIQIHKHLFVECKNCYRMLYTTY